MKRIGIIGYGGFAREIGCCLKNKFNYFVLNTEYDKCKKNDLVLPMSKFDPKDFMALVAVGNPQIRWNIVNKELPKNTEYFTFIDESVKILDKNTIFIGKGSMICSGSILTTNIKLGEHTILNLGTTIGHDTIIGDYFTTSPGVNIAGNCNIGNKNIFGIASSLREKIVTCDDVILGLNTGVVKNITESGIYTGTPAKKLK
jgi:sugar O-acyltransferase (sialic acid O-acetyltransferase NeuD family)